MTRDLSPVRSGLFKKMSRPFRKKSSQRYSEDTSAKDNLEKMDEKASITSHPPLKAQKSPIIEEQEVAVDLLRKRLKAELRPDLSPDGLHQIRMVQHSLDETLHQDAPSSGRKQAANTIKQMPSFGIRKVSNKWDHANPFRPASRLSATSCKALNLRNSSDFTRSQNPRTATSGPRQAGQTTFACDAGNYVPGPVQSRLLINPTSICSSNRKSQSNKTSTQHTPSLSKEGLTGTGKDIAQVLKGSNDCLPHSKYPTVDEFEGQGVVARVECELSHPQPSRSQEKKKLRVLIVEEDESRGEGCRQDRQASLGSSSSFYTARQEDTI